MMFSGTDINRKWRHPALQLLMGWSLTVLFSYSIFSTALGFNNNGEVNDSAIHQQHSPEQPPDVPLDSDSAPFEVQNEKDLKGSLDDEWGAILGDVAISRWSCYYSTNVSFFQHARSVQNRPTVSLFVLHHAWKSFLS